MALAFLLALCTLIYNVHGGGKGMVFSLKSSIYVRDSGMFMSDLMLNKPSSENPSSLYRREMEQHFFSFNMEK